VEKKNTSLLQENLLMDLTYGPTEILPHIYLGSEMNARKNDILLNLGITHILNVAEEIKPGKESLFKRLHVKLKDIPEENIDFEEIFKFIDGMTPSDKILIHCMAGISRSATIVIGYIMRLNNWDAATSIAFVKQKRREINPNLGFLSQLLQYEIKLHGKAKSAEIELLREYIDGIKGSCESFCRMKDFLKTKESMQGSYNRLVQRIDLMLSMTHSDDSLARMELLAIKKCYG